MSEHKCEHCFYDWGRSKPCGKPAKMEHEGKHYCGIHDPVKKAARQAERSAQRTAEWEARTRMNKERYAFEDAMKAATAGLSTATLTALAEAGGVKRVLELLTDCRDAMIELNHWASGAPDTLGQRSACQTAAEPTVREVNALLEKLGGVE